jgi:hypothetical protein
MALAGAPSEEHGSQKQGCSIHSLTWPACRPRAIGRAPHRFIILS